MIYGRETGVQLLPLASLSFLEVVASSSVGHVCVFADRFARLIAHFGGIFDLTH